MKNSELKEKLVKAVNGKVDLQKTFRIEKLLKSSIRTKKMVIIPDSLHHFVDLFFD